MVVITEAQCNVVEFIVSFGFYGSPLPRPANYSNSPVAAEAGWTGSDDSLFRLLDRIDFSDRKCFWQIGDDFKLAADT